MIFSVLSYKFRVNILALTCVMIIFVIPDP